MSGVPNERAPLNSFAIVSLTLGLAWPITLGLTTIPGLIFGIIAMNQCIDREERGGGMALFATFLNVLGLGLMLFFFSAIAQL